MLYPAAAAFEFLLDRTKVQSFLSIVQRRVLEQGRRGGLQRQCGLLEWDTEGLLLDAGRRVARYALAALGPIAVAGRVVGAR